MARTTDGNGGLLLLSLAMLRTKVTHTQFQIYTKYCIERSQLVGEILLVNHRRKCCGIRNLLLELRLVQNQHRMHR